MKMNLIAYYLLFVWGILSLFVTAAENNQPPLSRIFCLILGISLIAFSSIGIYMNW
jgi:uncharacterized membrane protein